MHLHCLGGLLGLHLVRAVHNDTCTVLELASLKQLDDRLHRAAGLARTIGVQHLRAFREGRGAFLDLTDVEQLDYTRLKRAKVLADVRLGLLGQLLS